MTKADYFHQLQERLRGLPPGERQNILRIYEDLFRQAEASGKSELEIIQSLGYVQAQEWTPPQEHFPTRPVKNDSVMRMVMASVALGLFNLVFVLGPALAIGAVLFSFGITSIALILSPLLLIWEHSWADTGLPLYATLLASMAFSGLGVLMGIGSWKGCELFTQLLKRYITLNMRLIRGE